jgi:microcompartment protein CcmL/EutN
LLKVNKAEVKFDELVREEIMPNVNEIVDDFLKHQKEKKEKAAEEGSEESEEKKAEENVQAEAEAEVEAEVEAEDQEPKFEEKMVPKSYSLKPKEELLGVR